MGVTNTARDDRHPEWLAGRNPAAIEAQEARGQAELARSGLLPTKVVGATEDDLRADGIALGDPLEDDPLFRPATLPDGWAVRPDPGHAMWSEVIDDADRPRWLIFYKAAFYDRRAHISPS